MNKSTGINQNNFKFDHFLSYLLVLIGLPVLALFRHGSFFIPILFCIFGLLQIRSVQSLRTSLLTSIKNPIWYTCAVFLGLCFLSTTWSVLPHQTLVGSLQFGGLLIFYALLFALIPKFMDHKPLMWKALIFVFFTSGILIMLAEKEIFNIRELLGLNRRLFKPNMELLSILAIPLGCYIYQYYSKILSFLFFIFTLYLCIVCDLRASFYGLIIASLSIPFWYYRPKLSSYIASFGTAIYAFTLPLAVLLFNFENHVKWFVKNQGGSFVHRLFIWKFVSEKTREKLIFGWGALTSKNFPDEVRILPFEGSETWPTLPSHPHNVFMQVWLELGLVGEITFLLFWIFCFIGTRHIKSPHQRTAIGVLLTAIIPILSLSHSLWHTWWISWIVFVGFLCLILPEKNQ